MTESPDEKSLRRVLFVSGLDGWGVALFAGLCTLISLLLGEWVGVGVGGLITAAGVLELRGRGQLQAGQSAGLRWLVRAQLLILAVIGLYALENLLAFNEETLLAEITPEMKNAMAQAGVSMDDLRPMFKPVYYSLYLTVIAVTAVFQGGLALYYNSRRERVRRALDARAQIAPPSLR